MEGNFNLEIEYEPVHTMWNGMGYPIFRQTHIVTRCHKISFKQTKVAGPTGFVPFS